MPRWIIGLCAIVLIGAILVVVSLFMSTGPTDNQLRSPGEPSQGQSQPGH